MFASLTPAPPDAILGLTEAFNADPSPAKVNLGVGVYKDEQGRTPVLATVKAAEVALAASETTKNYLPIAGEPEFGRRVEELLFAGWPVHRENRLRTAHTPGGTGALRLGAEFLAEIRRGAGLWLSAPTWPNHPQVFAAAGFTLREYPYYNSATRGVRTAEMFETLAQVPAGDVVVLHLCCHNPTGADLAPADWARMAELAKAQGWIPFIDAAYIGFGEGLNEDRAGLKAFADAGVDFVVASSFSKNMGLYRERTGALTVAAGSTEGADRAFSRVKRVARVIYSNPPAHGGLIARRILEDALLRSQWEAEVTAMRERIHHARTALADGLAARRPGQDFRFICRQRGMFSFSGLTPAQVDYLRAKKSLYMTKDGRINVAGVTPQNLDYVCDAMAAAMQEA